VGLYHLERNNRTGARSQLRKAVTNLEGCRDATHGLDAAGLIRQLEATLAEESGGEAVRIARLK
jgi:hypothetical protein